MTLFATTCVGAAVPAVRTRHATGGVSTQIADMAAFIANHRRPTAAATLRSLSIAHENKCRESPQYSGDEAGDEHPLIHTRPFLPGLAT